ncbi:MAG: hypothetical protein GF309_06795 [Candidatus Lokiarchaeota archaeon]|nr:hypothetical protein [Candidatus Lokiarchaeota archaeon]
MTSRQVESNMGIAETVKISPRLCGVWIIASIASFAVALLSPILTGTGYFGALFYATNLSATILLHGIPFSLAAVLLFATEKSRALLSRVIAADHRPFLVFVVRLFALFAMSFFLYAGLIFVSFVMAAQVIPNLDFFVILWDFPVALVSALVLSWILSSIVAFSTTLIDDWRGAVFFNTAVCVMPGLYFGPTPQTPAAHGEQSLYGFYHMFRFLAVLLSRHEFMNESQMIYQMSIAVNLGDLIVPLAVLLGISFLFNGGTVPLFRENVKRWFLETERFLNDREETEPEDEETKVQHMGRSLKELRKKLQQQRQGAVIGFVILWLVIPLVGMYDVPTENNGSEGVLYASPADGIMIELGEWLCGQVEIPKPPSGRDNAVEVLATIINWGNCPEPLSAKAGALPCTLDYFRNLDDEAKAQAISGTSVHITRDAPSAGGGFYNIGDNYGNYTWAVQFFEEGTNETDCTLTIRVEVSYQQFLD